MSISVCEKSAARGVASSPAFGRDTFWYNATYAMHRTIIIVGRCLTRERTNTLDVDAADQKCGEQILGIQGMSGCLKVNCCICANMAQKNRSSSWMPAKCMVKR